MELIELTYARLPSISGKRTSDGISVFNALVTTLSTLDSTVYKLTLLNHNNDFSLDDVKTYPKIVFTHGDAAALNAQLDEGRIAIETSGTFSSIGTQVRSFLSSEETPPYPDPETQDPEAPTPIDVFYTTTGTTITPTLQAAFNELGMEHNLVFKNVPFGKADDAIFVVQITGGKNTGDQNGEHIHLDPRDSTTTLKTIIMREIVNEEIIPDPNAPEPEPEPEPEPDLNLPVFDAYRIKTNLEIWLSHPDSAPYRDLLPESYKLLVSTEPGVKEIIFPTPPQVFKGSVGSVLISDLTPKNAPPAEPDYGTSTLQDEDSYPPDAADIL